VVTNGGYGDVQTVLAVLAHGIPRVDDLGRHDAPREASELIERPVATGRPVRSAAAGSVMPAGLAGGRTRGR
jgi:hypothetical protein